MSVRMPSLALLAGLTISVGTIAACEFDTGSPSGKATSRSTHHATSHSSPVPHTVVYTATGDASDLTMRYRDPQHPEKWQYATGRGGLEIRVTAKTGQSVSFSAASTDKTLVGCRIEEGGKVLKEYPATSPSTYCVATAR
jgi:hypothetical protein